VGKEEIELAKTILEKPSLPGHPKPEGKE